MVVATRYAKSLLDLSVEKGQLDAVYKDMLLIKNVCSENHDFVKFLESPVIKTDKKKEVIQAVFGGKVSELSIAFINIIASKRREMYLPHIASAFVEQYKKHKHILTAVITSAVGLDEQTRNKVLELVKPASNGEVELVEKTDKQLIGGFIIRIGDKQVDASIARKLVNLRKNYTENPFISDL